MNSASGTGSGGEGGGSTNGSSVFDNLEKLNDYLHSEAARKAQAKGIDYISALREVGQENPTLVALRQKLLADDAAKSSGRRAFKLVNDLLVDVEQQIGTALTAAMLAHPKLDSGSAMKLVASERPELFRTRQQLREFLR